MKYKLESKLLNTNLDFAPQIEYVDSGDVNNPNIIIYLLGADVRPIDNAEFIINLSNTHRVITIHFPSKHNYKTMGKLGADKYFAVYNEIINHFQFKDIDLIGTSLGGSLAIKYSNIPALKVNIKHIVAIAPLIQAVKVPFFKGLLKLTERMIKRTYQQRNLVPVIQHLRHFMHLKALLKITGYIAELDITKDIETTKTPTLIFICGKDDLVGHNNTFFELKKGDNIKHRVFDDADHSLLFTHIEDILEDVMGFIN